MHNSAYTSVYYMENVWRQAEELHCNTLLVPVYWETIEPQENCFAFDSVVQVITDARKHHLKLILLWFGSWKNGFSTYAPAWIKTDLQRFPRTETEYGIQTRALSMFQTSLLPVGKRAFAKLMAFVHDFDHDAQTVIAVQVENEVGILGASRDYSSAATQAYQQPVPSALTMQLQKSPNPKWSSVAAQFGQQAVGEWSNVFSLDADEVFMCWHYAAYIGELVQAGKSCYPLPMFTNAWQKEFADERPGSYPCGGPLPEMLDVWKCAAPHLDALSPDIYTFDFATVAALYARLDNPLLIPAKRAGTSGASQIYTAP